MLLPGIALNFGGPRSQIRVQLSSGLEVTAIAATEINKSQVTVGITEDNKYLVWADTHPRNGTHPEISLSRRKPRTVSKTKNDYPIKVLVRVDNGNKAEIWLGGDRKTPVKIHELSINNAIDIQNIALSNLGKKERDWIAYLRWDDANLPVNFNGVRAFDGSTVISFLKPNETVTYGISEGIGDKPYQQNMENRGNGLANINPRFFASIFNLPQFPTSYTSTTTRNLYDLNERALRTTGSIIPITIAASGAYVYNGWTELDLYVLSGLENNPVRLFDIIPILQDDILNTNYDFSSLTHNNVRQYLNPFAKGRNFQESIEQRSLTDFALTTYKGFFGGKLRIGGFFLSAIAHDYVSDDPFNFLGTGYVYETYLNTRGSLFQLIDKAYGPLNTRRSGSFRHLIQTRVYTVNDKADDYYLRLGLSYNDLKWHEFSLIIDHVAGSFFFNYDNVYQLITNSYDAVIPLAEAEFNNYALNNLIFTGSHSFLNSRHFRFYLLGESTPNNSFFRNLSLTKISGSVNLPNIEKQANINYVDYGDGGTTPPLINNRWQSYNETKTRYKVEIPYIYFKGNTSKIIATFKVDLKISTSEPIVSYEETYQLYWNNQRINITDIIALRKPVPVAGVFINVLDIQPHYDNLVDNHIYRVVADNTLDQVVSKNVKLSVIKYRIDNNGIISQIDTKKYNAFSLKQANGQIWSASFYPP